MPQQSSPPYAWAAQQYPRQLDQWDDINNQNGKLQRTKTFITLNPFNINVTWLGFSDIVAAWNFEASNNFSLKPYTAIASTNYVLCISFRIGFGLIRYKLWDAAGSVLPYNTKQYNGQPILKNFRLEVWSTNQGNACETVGMQFFTSVLGSLDYRYGYDGPLQVDDGLITNFACNTTVGGTPVSNGVLSWYTAQNGLGSGYWSPSYGNAFSSLYPGGSAFNTNSTNTLKAHTYANSAAGIGPNSGAGGNLFDIWLLYQFVGDDTIMTLTTGSGTCILSTVNGVLQIDGNTTGQSLVVGQWYVLEWWQLGNNNGCFVWPLTSAPQPTSYNSQCAGNSRYGCTSFSLGTTQQVNIAELIMVEGVSVDPTLPIQKQILSYLVNTYFYNYLLPLTFPSNAVSANNPGTYMLNVATNLYTSTNVPQQPSNTLLSGGQQITSDGQLILD